MTPWQGGACFQTQTQAHSTEDGGARVRQIRWTGAEKHSSESGGGPVPGVLRDPAGAGDDAVWTLGVPALFPAHGEADQPVLSAVPAAGVQLGPQTVPREEPGERRALGADPPQPSGEMQAEDGAERRTDRRRRYYIIMSLKLLFTLRQIAA